MKSIITVKKKKNLKELIENEINRYGNQCDLNHLDVSRVTDMSNLFSYSEFNGDISKWNVSQVDNMSDMFSNSQFNNDISAWDVSYVISMNHMFAHSKFNTDISKWNISNTKDMTCMFLESDFTTDLTDWKPYKLNNKYKMFEKSLAPEPYWFVAKDMIKAIQIYELNEKLNLDLDDNTVVKRRMKI